MSKCDVKRVVSVGALVQRAGGVVVRAGLKAGVASTDVVSEKVAVDLVASKHIAGVKYED